LNIKFTDIVNTVSTPCRMACRRHFIKNTVAVGCQGEAAKVEKRSGEEIGHSFREIPEVHCRTVEKVAGNPPAKGTWQSSAQTQQRHRQITLQPRYPAQQLVGVLAWETRFRGPSSFICARPPVALSNPASSCLVYGGQWPPWHLRGFHRSSRLAKSSASAATMREYAMPLLA
jgi:hypothetical protein